MNGNRQSVLIILTAVATAGVSGLLAPARADDSAEDKPQRQANTVVVQEAQVESNDEGQPTQVTIHLDVVKPGKYWIGVVCRPLEDELLKTHLGLAHGMVVTEVVQGSPAEKAGLQPQDILVEVDDKPLTDLRILVESAEEAASRQLTLTVVRQGKSQEVKVVPAERPAKYSATGAWPDNEAAAEWKLLQETLRSRSAVPKTENEQSTQPDHTSMMFVMPGFVLPDTEIDFPQDLEVTVTKKGDAAAKVTVKRGDDQWVVDAESLDQLPADIRPHVQRMLGRGLSVTVGSNLWNWSAEFPKPLAVPEILKKSFKISPGEASGVLEITPRRRSELREKVKNHLKDVDNKLEQAQTTSPAEALEKIQIELKTLREQLEQLRGERATKTEREDEADDDQ